MLVHKLHIKLPPKQELRPGAASPKAKLCYALDPQLEAEEYLLIPKSAASFFKTRLPKSMELSELYQLKDEILKDALKQRALSFLQRRSYARQELRDRLLAEGYPEQELSLYLDKLEELALIDDKALICQIISSKQAQLWGQKKIEHYLRTKGLNPYELEGYPHEFYSKDSQYEQALTLLSKKFLGKEAPYEKLYRFLASRGYNPSLIYDVIKDFKLIQEEEGQ